MKSIRNDISKNITLVMLGNKDFTTQLYPFFNFSTFVLFAICIFTITSCQDAPRKDLGTFNNPEEALKETQKVFALLSNNLNKGYKSVDYIKEYEIAKDKIFNID